LFKIFAQTGKDSVGVTLTGRRGAESESKNLHANATVADHVRYQRWAKPGVGVGLELKHSVFCRIRSGVGVRFLLICWSRSGVGVVNHL